MVTITTKPMFWKQLANTGGFTAHWQLRPSAYLKKHCLCKRTCPTLGFGVQILQGKISAAPMQEGQQGWEGGQEAERGYPAHIKSDRRKR